MGRLSLHFTQDHATPFPLYHKTFEYEGSIDCMKEVCFLRILVVFSRREDSKVSKCCFLPVSKNGGLSILSNQVANEPEKDMSTAENGGFFIPSYTCQIVWHSLFDRNVEKRCPHAALWFPS
jgi:hypothetical protein